MRGIEIYAEQKPDKRFLKLIKAWLKERDIKAKALLVSRSNLVIAILPGLGASGLICFYMQKLCSLGTGGLVIYYDLTAMNDYMKHNVENTFTNWLAQKAIT